VTAVRGLRSLGELAFRRLKRSVHGRHAERQFFPRGSMRRTAIESSC
jgi:hypothetical protein